ncbi:MAG: exosortase C-terminal domain/associated protein EpsI [Verrucomicrobiota bacterium]
MITKRLLTVELVLLAGFGAVLFLPHATKTSPAGIAMTLPNVVAAWLGDDAPVTDREREVLSKDTQFARKTYIGPQGDEIYVSIVMSGDDMTNSIHRPERCLPAQGWTLQSSEKRVLPLRGGKSLELTKLHNYRAIEQPDKSRPVLNNLSYYWFVGSTEMTASHLMRTEIDLRDRILHGYSQRWAYITVAANVSKGWTRPERTEEETTEAVEQFIKDLAPLLKRPDGSALL